MQRRILGKKRSTNGSYSISMSRRGIPNFKLNQEQKTEIVTNVIAKLKASTVDIERRSKKDRNDCNANMELMRIENELTERNIRELEAIHGAKSIDRFKEHLKANLKSCKTLTSKLTRKNSIMKAKISRMVSQLKQRKVRVD